MVATPNLSQDFYRFIWDGRMILEGFNPYLYTPFSFIEHQNYPIAQAHELYFGMGELNASHFTNYPPLNQLCFVVATIFNKHSIISAIVGLRVIIIAADIGTLYFGKKLLEKLNLPVNRIFWYALNPFIIIELTGNLHFEGVLLFFLVWSLYLLHCNRWKWAAVVFGCSISVKLIPLMFLPLFFWWFSSETNSEKKRLPKFKDLKQLITFYTLIIATVLLIFTPFFSMEFINNYSKSVGLWFGDFEFNASIYYLLRAIGYAISGYNEIGIITKFLPLISLVIILSFSFFKQNTSIKKLATVMLLSFTFYLLLSTTVHPWYISTLVLLSIFTKYRFPIVWSFVIILSYLAYSNASNTENLWIIGLEYFVIFGFIIWEVILKKKTAIFF